MTRLAKGITEFLDLPRSLALPLLGILNAGMRGSGNTESGLAPKDGDSCKVDLMLNIRDNVPPDSCT